MTGRIEMGPTARTVAANVRRLREARGLSLRGLSQLLDGVGRNLSADAINKIENCRLGEVNPKQTRRADVDDVTALALVLNVSPLTLLLPPASGDERVHLTDTVTVTAGDVWRWAEGRQSIPAAEDAAAQHERQTAYDSLTLPPERRRLESLPAVQSVRRLHETLAELVQISPDASHSSPHAARAAQRRHQQLGYEIDGLVDELPPD
ncbi:helix-turn-helix domain-containing protein [Streptomyces sp. NPDC091385]|uniref:helix-turn-helix domain-containing protein n=1 Tax=Streptomyces sp. NPDC091385 TaxID=3365997 RepID=UPI0038050691